MSLVKINRAFLVNTVEKVVCKRDFAKLESSRSFYKLQSVFLDCS